ncbi:MAG: helix-turn-helix domain-containing protein [Saprospiraceae bacterium]
MNATANAKTWENTSLPFSDPEEKIMSVGDLADEVGVSIHAVYAWIRRGKLKNRKVGRTTIFLRSETYQALKGTKYELAR